MIRPHLLRYLGDDAEAMADLLIDLSPPTARLTGQPSPASKSLITRTSSCSAAATRSRNLVEVTYHSDPARRVLPAWWSASRSHP